MPFLFNSRFLARSAAFCVGLVAIQMFIFQAASAQSSGFKLKVIPDKPSIYVTFEKRGPRSPLRDNEKGRGIYLRLHNNLKVTIRFCAFDIVNGVRMAFYSEGGDIGINYEVDGDPAASFSGPTNSVASKRMARLPIPVGYPTGGLCHSYELAGGKSLEFSVPVEHLSDGLLIKIPFNYEWELPSEDKPSHFVTFGASDLP